ncbi:MAG: hypothetical protein ABEN55_09815, partial [Bradymonadaceae bacterium]
MRTFPATYAPVAALVALVLAGGCNLPGLPGTRSDTVADTGLDTAPPDDVSRTCNPDADESEYPKCSAGAVLKCVEGGTRVESVPCGDDEICQTGRCRPVDNQCDTPLPFRLSKSTLDFESNGRLRSDSDSVVVENCSDLPIILGGASVEYPSAEVFPSHLDVFTIANRFSLDGVHLPPGEELSVRVKYAPTDGFFLLRDEMSGSAGPTLSLDLRASRTYVTEMP